MSARIFKRAFSSGEISPELYGRLGLSVTQEGLALCRNFITLPHGPAFKRPGTAFVEEVKDAAVATRLIPFSYNNQQQFAIQVGAGYFRWHSLGETLKVGAVAAYVATTAYALGALAAQGGVNYYCISPTTGNAPPNAIYWYALPANGDYEIPNPYAASELFDIGYTPSADVLTLVHPKHPILELRRYGATNWQVAYPEFNPPVSTLTGVTATPTGTGTVNYEYVVTALLTALLEESSASASASCVNLLTTAGNINTITWTDNAPAGTNVRYNVYRDSNGIYGFVGQSGSASFVDDNITPDISRTPPLFDNNFAAPGDYPKAVAHYQQRRVFAGTTDAPQEFWMTRSGTESDMGYSIPIQADDRLDVRIAAREASAIRHLVALTDLILLTASAAWRVNGGSPGAPVVASVPLSAAPQSYTGANSVTPVVVNNRVLFAASRGGHIWELGYLWQYGSYVSEDLSLMAQQLFDYRSLTDMAFTHGPNPVLWVISDNGSLLGMTYVPMQKISAWHHHDTGNGDAFESVCAITEPGASGSLEDIVYVTVRRTINGATVRYVERMHSRYFAAMEDAFFVDAGIQQTFAAPVTVISGLSWLEGCTVSILADGAVTPEQKVVNGSFTLAHSASKITVGLPIVAQLETPPAAQLQDPALMQGKLKNVNRLFLRVYRSSGIWAGPNFNDLTEFPMRTNQPYGSPPALISDEVELAVTPEWAAGGQVCVESIDPLPLDVVDLTLEMSVGGGI